MGFEGSPKDLTILLLLLPSLSAGQAALGYAGQSTNLGDAIERYRKGDVLVRVLDDNGRPVSGASISYKQSTRDFLFGVGAGANYVSTWYALKAAGMNHVEMYMSWNLTDAHGPLSWLLDNLSTLKRLGFALSGHCLVWMVGSYPNIPGADPWNLPTRVKSLNYDELKGELRSHIYETVSFYKPFVTYWDINEPFWPYADPFHLDETQWMEILDLSIRAIKEADPNAKIYVNNILGDLAQWKYYPVDSMRMLIKRGVNYDAIGVELYGGAVASLVAVDGRGYPVLSTVSSRLDQYGKLGKPVLLTEVDVSDIPGEKAQADWATALYTMAFGKPYIKGIAWSFMFDDPFLPGAGIFDCENWDQYHICSDAKPKQAYYALKNLLASWSTEGNGVTDSEGDLRFRGFAGNYSMTVTAEGFKQLDTVIHVQEQIENPFEIHVQTMTVPLTTATTEGIRTTALTSTLGSSTVTSSYAFALSQQVYVAVAGVLVVCLVVGVMITRKRKKRQ
jgi:hypothetical protein